MTVVTEFPPSKQNSIRYPNFCLRIQLFQLKEQVQLIGEKTVVTKVKLCETSGDPFISLTCCRARYQLTRNCKCCTSYLKNLMCFSMWNLALREVDGKILESWIREKDDELSWNKLLTSRHKLFTYFLWLLFCCTLIQ